MADIDMSSISHAIILAGGFGTRLQPVVSDRPKALAEVAGKPFIEYQLEWILKQGIYNVTLAVHYMADQLQDFISNKSDDYFMIDSVYEQQPLGTGGAIANVIQQKQLSGKILVINGDTLFNFSLQPALRQIQKMKQPALLISSEQDNVARFGTLKIENGYVKSFKQATGLDESGIVNGGAYILESALFSDRKVEPFSLEYDLFPELAVKNQLTSYLVDNSESFFDIGVPESYKYICSKGDMQ